MARVRTVDDLRAPAIRDTFPHPSIRGIVVPNASREVPEIVCPFPEVEPHPMAGRLKKDNLQWIIDNGMAPPYPGATEERVLERLQRQRMPDLHARMWCDSPKYEYLALADKLLTFFWIVDDYMDEAWSDQDRALQLDYTEAFRPVLQGKEPGVCRDAWGMQSINVFAELWSQVRSVSPANQLKRHASVINTWLDISLDKGGEFRRQHQVPTVPHILANFIRTHGMDMFIPWNEIALNAFLPDEIYQHPSVSDTNVRFMNVVCWYNDIYGFNRDMASGEVYNLVAAQVVHEGKSVADAVTFLVERINSEMVTLEFMARSAEKCSAGNDKLERYTIGIKKVVRAMLEWHALSGKYDWKEVFGSSQVNSGSRAATAFPGGPTGLGTSAARAPSARSLGLKRFRNLTHIPYQTVGPAPLPEFYMPYALRLNPHLAAAREHLMTWGRQMGLLDPTPGVPRGALWSEDDLRSFDFALCAAGLDPDADLPGLNLSSRWLCWRTYADDYYPAVFGRGRNMAAAKAQNRRLLEFMPAGSAATPPAANPVERGLADLWSRTTQEMTAGQKREFRGGVVAMIDSWLWDLADGILHRIPDPVDYMEMRRKTFGSPMHMALAWISDGQHVPLEIHQTKAMLSMEDAASDYCCLLNDIFSYQKEIEFEGELHNGVLAVENFLGCDVRQAIKIVNDLMTERMHQFERLVTTGLPALFQEYHLDEEARNALRRRVQELEDWMASILNWHAQCGRYREPELIRRYRPGARQPMAGPTGLGTSAARVGRW